MRECNGCGFLLKFARFFEWRSDGTIVSTNLTRRKVRILFMVVGEMESVFDEISRVIGTPVERKLIEAERNVGKEFLADTPLIYVKHIPGNRLFRPQFLAKVMTRLVRNDVAGLGCGVVSVESYRAGKYLTLRFSNPYFVPGTVGNTLGVYELLEGLSSAEYEYGVEDNGDLVIHFSDSGKPGKPLSESRLHLEKVTPGTGPISYDRCGKCGTPLAVAEAFKWNLERGIITDRSTGEREAVGSSQSINAMLRELVDEFGEKVTGILYDAQKGLSRRRLEGYDGKDPAEFWEGYLFDLALRGLGFPDHFESDEKSVTVEIRTAYEQTLYAARIAGALESLTGRRSAVRWYERGPDTGAYTISATGQ